MHIHEACSAHKLGLASDGIVGLGDRVSRNGGGRLTLKPVSSAELAWRQRGDTMLAMNMWAAYQQVSVEELSVWSAFIIVAFTGLIVGRLGTSVIFYHGVFVALSVFVAL